ncbi:MAG: hypothetical protein CMH56_16125 [Myxococcales bacterium]|nr:hypothetical protein [Myxococcales bacterium]
MEEEKIRAIADLVAEGNAYTQAGEKREAVKSYAAAYKDMQEVLVGLHALWVNAYEAMTDGEDAIDEAQEAFDAMVRESAEKEEAKALEIAQSESASQSSVVEETPTKDPPKIIGLAEEAQRDENTFSVAKEDVDRGPLSIQRIRTNPFAQAARDLAAAVVEAASDVAAAVVDVRTKTTSKSSSLDVTETAEFEDRVSDAGSQDAAEQNVGSVEDVNEMEAPGPVPNSDAQLAVLQNLLEQVRDRKHP